MREVAIPAVGFAMTEAVLVQWTRQPGDEVSQGDAIAEIETDKATADLEAPISGILGRHRFAPGDLVPVGVALTVVLAPGEVETDGPNLPADAATSPEVADASTVVPPVPVTSEPDAVDGETGRRRHRESPRQRAGHRADATATSGIGTVPAPDAGRFRSLIADKVSESWRTIPHFAVTREISAETILECRSRRRAEGRPVPTVTDLLVRGLALALETTGGSGPAAPVDVGLAVATAYGVAIPVLRDVLALSIEELSAARVAALDRARSGRLSPDDLRDPPRSTLSNLGALGVDQFTGVIAGGQTSLLTVGRITRRVVALDDAIAVRPMFTATLNADHRSLDGAGAAAILGAFADAVTTIARLELETAG